jgi:hypothetical protein
MPTLRGEFWRRNVLLHPTAARAVSREVSRRSGFRTLRGRARGDVLSDYHLRVGQVTHDTRIPEGYALQEHRLHETEVGVGTALTFIDAKRSRDAKPMIAERLLSITRMPRAARLSTAEFESCNQLR